MKSVTYSELQKFPQGTLYVHESPDPYVRRAMFEVGDHKNPPQTSPAYLVLESKDLRAWQEKIEFALGLIRPRREDPDEEEVTEQAK